MFIDPDKAKFYGCLQFEFRKNSREVLTTFLSIFVRVYINNVLLICNEIRRNPEVSFEQRSNFRQKGSCLAYDLLLSLCYSMNVEHFEKIYQNFVSVKDYNSSCFKILNKHYLIYLELRERYYLKHRREEDFDEKKFDLVVSKELGTLLCANRYLGFKKC